jgi:hypothetical protein
MGTLEMAVGYLLDSCKNTTVSTEIANLQSQVTRLSELGNVLTSGMSATTTYSEIVVTHTGLSTTWTETALANPSWTAILSTATGASSSAPGSAGMIDVVRDPRMDG